MVERFSWTQPCCDDCWDRDNPDRLSPRRGQGAPEICCHCGLETRSGIYIRIDPTTVAHPTRTNT